jgi:predicted enzyme related to lactoylglutathione lyase
MASERVKVARLAHVVYQHPDLDRALSFLHDFGFVEEDRSIKGRVYLRGYGTQPYLYIAEQSPDDKRHFLGAFFVVEALAELEKASKHASATSIEDLDAPGGGKIVTVQDPNGFKVGFVYGQELRKASNDVKQLERTPQFPNTVSEKARKGTFRRFKTGPSPVHKLGHYGFMVPPSKFEETLSFYTELMNLKPSDIVYDPETGENRQCFCHIDLGQTYTDHHVGTNLHLMAIQLTLSQSFFLACMPDEKPAHPHHSSYEVNDFDVSLQAPDKIVSGRTRGHHRVWCLGGDFFVCSETVFCLTRYSF